MGSYGGEPRAARSRTGLSEPALPGALVKLLQLAREPLFGEVDRALAALGRSAEDPGLGPDAVGQLRQWSAEYQRVALDLEATARCCRLVEQEINRRVDAILAEKNKSLAGQVRDIFRRARPTPRYPPAQPEPLPDDAACGVFACSPPGLFVTAPSGLSAASGRELSATAQPERPAADIAASALGPFEVHVAGRRVPKWTSLKARSVFQYLLIHRDRPIRRDVLMALQWPDHSHTSARNNLNVALYNLRNTLDGLGQGTQPILYRDGCYILNPELTWWVDRSEFLTAVDDARRAHREDRPEHVIGAYRKAIRLYRGPLFEDDGDGEWYLPEQRRLRDLYGQALEGIAEIHLRLGELPDARQFGQLALEHDPCSESVHRLLMRCYASQHQQQLVSRQYRECVDALRDELGVAPSDETTRLFRDLA
jgi:SARP family transcriptional regulator, regulator of embCAB operon